MNALIFGGDARQLEVSRMLMERGDHVFMAGFEQAEAELKGAKTILLEKLPYDDIDLFILPVSGVKNNGLVDAPFSSEPLFLTKEIMEKLPDSCVVVSGIETPFLKKNCMHDVIYIFDREDAAILNSIPTAEGTLMIAIQETPYTIHGANIFVIGFGRVGMTIARLFYQLGGMVTTAVRETEKFARAKEMALNPIYMSALQQEIGKADIVINTVPALVLDEELIRQLKPSALIVDIASQPGGTNFKAAEKAGIKTIHALGLPGKVAPKTAGEILGTVLMDAVQEWKMERGL